jgi:hypothetical protein
LWFSSVFLEKFWGIKPTSKGANSSIHVLQNLLYYDAIIFNLL